MRWIWIDRIIELERGTRCVAIKNISLGEDVLHDHFPADPGRGQAAMPVMPNSLVIEGMAQTAGILVGHANDFSENVILAKITKASFTTAARPGHTLRYTALLDRLEETGALTCGHVDLLDPATGESTRMGQIELMFSHLDHTHTSLDFPDYKFVFTSQFMDLLPRSEQRNMRQ